MATAPGGWTDQQVDEVIGNLLRAGVLASALITAVGGIVYLAHHGGERSNHGTFHGEPKELPDLNRPSGAIRYALQQRGRGLIQLGILVLLATPVARVIFSVFAFFRQHDHTYVIVTLIVLAVLLYSLFGQGP
jgi:uncharacterized membrane protein